MKLRRIVLIVSSIFLGCSPQRETVSLPSWNDTPVKEKLIQYLDMEVDKIPVEDRIAVFDLDGTLVCERPWPIEMMAAVYRVIYMGEKDPVFRQTLEYQYAKKLAADPRDTSVLHHCVVNGENILDNIVRKPFDGIECEEYIRFVHDCLNTEKNPDHGRTYVDMFYQPMLELVEQLKKKQFQVYVVSASRQGVVWGICPEVLGVDRTHLLGNRRIKEISFPKNGPVSYIISYEALEPHNNFKGKPINIYNHIGKTPVVAVGNKYSDFGMFHMVSCSPHPHLALMLNHDDAEREYVYPPAGRRLNWQDTLKSYGWLQADMSKEFKVVWRKK